MNLRKRILKGLPRKIRHPIYRRLLKLDREPSLGLKIKIAETKAELEMAFTILHDAYVDSGFMEPNPTGMRLSIHHALPTTTTFIALVDDVIVGTVSLIGDSFLGLPMDKIYDLKELRRGGKRIAEISGLAIHREFRGKQGEINLPLTKAVYEYSKKLISMDFLTIAVNPAWADYYEAIWAFTRLRNSHVSNYDFVKGAPAVGLQLDLNGSESKLARLYPKHLPAERNFFSYLVTEQLRNICLPKREFSKVSDPVMTPRLLNHFFNVKSTLFSELSDIEKINFRATYFFSHFETAIPKPDSSVIHLQRRHSARFPTKLIARLHESNFQDFDSHISVINVSEGGLAVRRDGHSWKVGAQVSLKVQVAKPGTASIRGTIVAVARDVVSIRTDRSDDLWMAYLEHLGSDLMKLEHSPRKTAVQA